jgi:predicted transposase YbfD/YdcC
MQKLLQLLAIDGAIVITGVMGFQCAIVRKIIEEEGRFYFRTEGNQGSFRNDVEWLGKRYYRPFLKAVAFLESRRECDSKAELERAFKKRSQAPSGFGQ